MSDIKKFGKEPVRKLGRGLSALLGQPVEVQVPKPPAAASEVKPGGLGDSRTQTQRAGSAMQEPVGSTGNQAHPSLSRPQASTPVQAPAPSASTQTPALAPASTSGSLREIPVERIVPNPRQPRTDFDQAQIEGLAASIRQSGLMQPILVRPQGDGFELVAGERRWRAAKLVGLETIPALVRVLDDQSSAELALIENVQREDLNPIERARALRRLSEDFGLTHQAIADRVGLDRASVTNLVRLADLDDACAMLVRSGTLSQGHAKALLSISDHKARLSLAERAIAQEWSVRELERQVQIRHQAEKGARPVSAPDAQDPSARDANVADLEQRLSAHLGTRVRIQLGRKKGSGRLILDFYNLEQFDGIMQRIGFDGRA
jgi:ParB family transcriptional regulator, chromosome partitioning protein